MDLRQGEVAGGPELGLLLHHPDLGERPSRLPPEPLSKVLATIKDDRAGSNLRIIQGYPDLLGRKTGPYWGGFQSFAVKSQNQPDAKWLVIIQEPEP